MDIQLAEAGVNSYIEVIPPAEKKDNPQKRCSVCRSKGKHKKSQYQCKTCGKTPGLHAAPCFEIYHTT